jgi:hypothetical protein
LKTSRSASPATGLRPNRTSSPDVDKTSATLGPGATAHAFLALFNVYDFPSSSCRPVTATELKIYPPNQRTPVYITFSFPACSVTGPVFLSTRTLSPGPGTPGHNVREPAD